jgi:ATP-dependent exoDNAse (exonuclease V) alpha subunit
MIDESLLTKDQKQAFQSICDWYETVEKKRNYFKLGGLAGTGKTTLINYTREKLNLQNVGYAAYTGKAASVMQQKGMPACTIHSIIYRPVTIKNQIHFEKKPVLDIDYELIVIDEASMVDKKIFDDLTSFNIPILFCGDYGQLPPIEESMGLMEEDELDAKLTTICRQDEHSNIILWSRKVRDGYRIPYCEKDDFIKIPFEDIDEDEFVNADQVICGLNKNRRYLNRVLRQYMGFDSIYPSKDEKVIITDNNYGYLVFNGQIVIAVTDMEPDKMTLMMPANRRIGKMSYYNEYESHKYLQRLKEISELKQKTSENSGSINFFDFSNIYVKSANFFLFSFDDSIDVKDLLPNERKNAVIADFAYTITCHKAQGSEWPNVLVVDDWPRRPGDSTRIKWLYTAITRASKRVVICDDFYT